MQPPDSYEVVYYLIKPLSHGLFTYAGFFDGRFPDEVNATALESLKRRLNETLPAGHEDYYSLADANWAFAVPAFAAARKLDFRYYGAGQRYVRHGPRNIVAAIEIARGSGTYDAVMSDNTRARLSRDRLP